MTNPRRFTYSSTFGVLLGLSLVMGAACGGSAPERPNMIFVLVDDLRWDDFGAAGHPFAETPHIDRLANEGAMFLNAFAATPLCSPSRAAFLTGLYAHTNGIEDNLARNETSHDLRPTWAHATPGHRRPRPVEHPCL